MAEIIFRLKVVTGDAKDELTGIEGKGKDVKTQLESPTTLKVNVASAIANLRDLVIVYQGVARVVGQVVRKTTDHIKSLKNYARDAEETANKFLVVYENIKFKAAEAAKSLASSFGTAISTAKELLANTGDILIGFGFTEEAALNLAMRVNSLAGDLVSFTNFAEGTTGASKALTKAILGETESAKALNIVLRQGTPEFKQQVKALQETEKMTYNQAMATILLKDAYKQSVKSIGDFARTMYELANQERILEEVTKTVREEVGAWLIPAFLKATKTINNFLSIELLPIIRSWTAEMELHKKEVNLTSQAYIDLGGNAKRILIETELELLKVIKASKESPAILQGWYNQIKKLWRGWTDFSSSVLNIGKNIVGTLEEITGGIVGDIWADWVNDLNNIGTALGQDVDGLDDINQRINTLNNELKDLGIDPIIDEEEIVEATKELEAFYAAKIILDRQAQLTGIALLKDKLSEEKKYYKDLGEVTKENEKDKIESYARILEFEKQIAKERKALLSKEQQVKEAAAEKEEREAEKKLREEKTRLQELSDLRTEFDNKQFDLTHSSHENQIEAINRYYRTRNHDLLEAGYDQIEINKQKNLALKQLEDKSYEGKIRASSRLFGDLAKIARAGGRKSFEGYKILSMVQATMDGISAAISAWKFGMQFGGPILAGIMTVASIGVTGARIKEMAGMKYAGGGYTGKAAIGTEPDETGQRPVGIVHENELVFQSPLMKKFGGFLVKLRTWMMGESPAPMFALAGGGFGEILPEMPAGTSSFGYAQSDSLLLDKLEKIEDAIKDNQVNINIEDNSDLTGFYKYYLKAKAEYEKRGLG